MNTCNGHPVYNRSIDYNSYVDIYAQEEKDSSYPKTDVKIRAALNSCFHGERQVKRNRKIIHCWEGRTLTGHGLELAFGFGTSLKWIFDRHDVTMDGIDFSEYMQRLIPYFREEFGDRIVDMWRGDISQIDKPDCSYDFINSCSVWEHLPDCVYWSTLRECFRILRPGGLIGVWVDKGRAHGSHLRMDPESVTRADMEYAGFEAISDYLYRKPE